MSTISTMPIRIVTRESQPEEFEMFEDALEARGRVFVGGWSPEPAVVTGQGDYAQAYTPEPWGVAETLLAMFAIGFLVGTIVVAILRIAGVLP